MALLVIDNGIISESASVVPVKTPNDFTLTRAVNGTVYTNTTGKTLYVNVFCQIWCNTAGDAASFALWIGVTQVGIIGIDTAIPAGLAGIKFKAQGHMDVAAGQTYKVVAATTAGGSVTLTKWVETW